MNEKQALSRHLGFIGLGQMGRHIAMNLMRGCAKLSVCSRRPEHFAAFAAKGAETTLKATDLAQADIIFLCLPGSAEVENTLIGKDGLLPLMRAGQIVVDLSTIKYSTTIELGRKLKEQGIGFLDAPISGMEARAKDGTLTVMCGGEEEMFNIVRPHFDCMASKVLHMGATGNGQLTKLINQLLFDINVAALAEILPMAAKMGLDPEKTGQVVNSGTGRSYASEFFIPRILQDNFSEGYSLQNAYKDLVSAAEISAEQGIPLPLTHAATTTYQMALCKGIGLEDKGAMIKVFEELLQLRFRKKK